MTAYGYIRKSVVHDLSRMLSPEMQEDAIRRLAAANGDDDVEILNDLDVSGRKGRSRRPGWDALLRAVEAGDAHAVYAYSLSRFARSVAQLAEFFELCQGHNVRVRVDRDQIDTSTATGKLVGNVLASLAQFEADVASERVKDAFAAKRAKDPSWRGPGQPRYGARAGEDPAVVIDAFREAKSYDGAAKLLNANGVPTRVKGRLWSGSVVRDLVQVHAKDELLGGVRRGAPAGRRRFRFSQLVACSACGTFLTGSRDGRTGHIRYSCPQSRISAHTRTAVSESKLIPVIKAEAERTNAGVKRMQTGTREDDAALMGLRAKRDRIIDLAADGLIDKAEAQRRIADVAEAESRLSTRRWIKRITLMPDIATDDPGRVNEYLRRLFERVSVDMSQPARRGPSSWIPDLTFAWNDPSLRRESLPSPDCLDGAMVGGTTT